MSDIFISYAREDLDKARLMAEALTEEGWDVWWDRRIPTGRTFDDMIEEAIGAARCMIVLWSRSSVESEWVRTEAAEGRSREILLPVFIEDVAAPLAFRLVQAADLTAWNGDRADDSFKGLCLDIARVAGSPTKPAEAVERDEPNPPGQPNAASMGPDVIAFMTRNDWIGAAFVLLTLVLFITAFFVAPGMTEMTSWQLPILRVVTSVCAGFAGFLFAGRASFNGKGIMPVTGKVTLVGSASLGVFLMVWFGFNELPTRKVKDNLPPVYATVGASLRNSVYGRGDHKSVTHYLHIDCGSEIVTTDRFFKGVYFLSSSPVTVPTISNASERGAFFDELNTYLLQASGGDTANARKALDRWTAQDTTIVCTGLKRGTTIGIELRLRLEAGVDSVLARVQAEITGRYPSQGIILEAAP